MNGYTFCIYRQLFYNVPRVQTLSYNVSIASDLVVIPHSSFLIPFP